MAIQATPESSGGILNAIKGSLGLFDPTNKATGVTENQTPIPADEYESSLSEPKVLELASQWKRTYSVYETEIQKSQKLAFDYWVGKHRNQNPTIQSNANADVNSDNLIFESTETFLPIATRANPDPLVNADPSDVGQELAHDVKAALVNFADTQLLRRKLAKGTRNWLLNRIGVWKLNWNPITKTIELVVVAPKRMLFDYDGYINEKCEFIGEYLAEKKRATAEILIEMFPKKEEEITKKAKGKMGTKLDYIEWWYRATDVFYTMDDDLVLGKFKNPNWNYDIEPTEAKEAIIDPETDEVVEEGSEGDEGVQATNHLKEKSYPYRFLSIFSTGEQPHDNTSLILQNIPKQDQINRREAQIEFNVKKQNNGMVVSGTAFTEEQASQASSALARGVAIRVPNGDVGKAVMFPEVHALPADVFNSLRDARTELKNIFGISGSTPEGIKSQESVRGKILINQMDSSRIGGGITEYIEQVADAIYNLVVQYIFVYYDEEHFITTAGAVSGMELISLKNDKFPLLKSLTVTVKEGSLIPKDPLTQRNEAIDLWSANAIDPRSLYKKLDFPDPDEATNQLILWQMLQKGQIQPQMYLPSFAVAGSVSGQPQPTGQPGVPTGQPQEPGTGGPEVSAVGASQPGGIKPQQPAKNESQQLIHSVPVK